MRTFVILSMSFLGTMSASPIYNIVAIPPPEGGNVGNISVAGLNNSGQVLEESFTASLNEVSIFLYSSATGVTNMEGNGPLAASSTIIASFNDLGQILLQSGMLYTPGSGFSNLVPIFSAADPGQALQFQAINDVGQVVTAAGTDDMTSGQILLYTPGQGVTTVASGASLRDLGGGYASLSNSGFVAYNTAGPGYTEIYSPGGQTTKAPCGVGFGYAVNNSGQVAGTYEALTPNGIEEYDPSLCTAAARIDLLANQTLYTEGSANAVNNLGAVIGSVDTNSSSQSLQTLPALFLDGQVYDLNSLIPANSGWQLSSAISINDSGQIAGMGVYNGVTEPFLMTPASQTPEPPTLLLTGCALVLLGSWRAKWTGR
jgi:hypothetical protein